ncbi:MAG TPA: preprotein translocase subunit YajC [Candidatus Cryptobacteroides merdipullorum]|uniref:Sec translocon accessory complex subunit YajC n=1 Tax=Candidatus Cryptobacteroides merdipullorum TaxID=2840771 RepID=A0A9D1KIV1_9BACT|nr:preprotein translocase subunit YajC [Candidatus Cryptobacteroides merdipullorum]
MITTVLQATGQNAGGAASMWIMLILLFLVMWLFMIRPQRKQQKALEEMRKALKKGDHVVTAGGIYGVICDVDERTVLIKVDGEVKLRVDKNSISLDASAQAPADKNGASADKGGAPADGDKAGKSDKK